MDSSARQELTFSFITRPKIQWSETMGELEWTILSDSAAAIKKMTSRQAFWKTERKHNIF